ncbi:Uncharacterised protein [Mycobacteroides abscessus subsp. abscessus]|nr:Uncharacterised protein [Mycobacteroides abscessus subsp. abscessus]
MDKPFSKFFKNGLMDIDPLHRNADLALKGIRS